MSKLMVRSLPWSARDQQLGDLFRGFGDMTECKVIMDREDPTKSRGFAFVTYRDPAAAERALQAMDNTEMDGRNIRVAYADNQRGAPSSAHPPQSRDQHHQRDHQRDRQREDQPRGGRDLDHRSARDDRGGERRERERSPQREGRGRRDDDRKHEEHVRRRGAGVDEVRDPSDDNSRIYITGLVDGTTEEELVAHFGMLGVVARRWQKRGYPNQWPFKVNLYKDESGKAKGDATLTYEDPNAAQSAPEFFNQTEFKGVKITVEPAAKWEQAQAQGAGEQHPPQHPPQQRQGDRGFGDRGGRGGHGRRY